MEGREDSEGCLIMKHQFWIPPHTHMTIDEIHRVTLMFPTQQDAEEFFRFIEIITNRPDPQPLTMEIQ